MSALGHKRTLVAATTMSALPLDHQTSVLPLQSLNQAVNVAEYV